MSADKQTMTLIDRWQRGREVNKLQRLGQLARAKLAGAFGLNGKSGATLEQEGKFAVAFTRAEALRLDKAGVAWRRVVAVLKAADGPRFGRIKKQLLAGRSIDELKAARGLRPDSRLPLEPGKFAQRIAKDLGNAARLAADVADAIPSRTLAKPDLTRLVAAVDAAIAALRDLRKSLP